MLAGWLAFFLVRVAGVALALVSGCLSCPPGAVLVAVSASLISTAARRHRDRHSNKKKKKRPGQRGAPPVAGPGAFNSCPGLGGVRGYARVGPGCQWAELAWATRNWMWTHSPLAPHHQPPVPVPVRGERRRGSCAPHADAEQGNDKGSQITCTFFLSTRHLFGNQKGSRLASCTASHYYWLLVLALVELLLRWLSLGRMFMFIYSNCGRDFILLSNTDRGTGSPMILSCNYSPLFPPIFLILYGRV